MNSNLRDLLSRSPGAGVLTGEDLCCGRSEHPICGDVLELQWRVEDSRIKELGWRAKGCPATLAVAAAAHESLVGVEVRQAATALRAYLQSLGGLEVHERHAERMVLRALFGDAG